MAAYPQYDIQDLSDFSGRPVGEYTNTAYAATALAQAILLFRLGTCLKEWPDDPTMAELAKMAILAMADSIYLVQNYQKILASPFSSETIGSYSYSKVAGAVMTGLPTGIGWFDMAVSQMGVCDLEQGTVIPGMGGGIEVFENDGYFTEGRNGNFRFLSPEDLDKMSGWGFDPSEGFRYNR